ncbi:MAG: DUF4982 domain-containing protein [Puniceicoccales bacterium]|nr:DUF4982 domain-containing protein [Puniceicoccales bacterium]
MHTSLVFSWSSFLSRAALVALVILGGAVGPVNAASRANTAAKSITGTGAAAFSSKRCFDFGWKFQLGDNAGFAKADFNDAGWQDVQLPHDWSIHLPAASRYSQSNGFRPGGVAWYRKHFKVTAGDGTGANGNAQNKKITILFDGVYHQSDVYLNGRHLGFHPYGYTGFEYDLTPYLSTGGDNVIAVRIDHSRPSSRWYSGSGIYRHVWLRTTNAVRVATWGTYITTPRITENAAEVRIKTTVENNTAGGTLDGNGRKVVVEQRVFDAAGNVVAQNEKAVTLTGKTTDIAQALSVARPALWSPETPNLYSVRTVIKDAEFKTEIDSYASTFGIRSIKFDPDKGFSINGKAVKLKGICMHHDHGALGTAVPDRANVRKLEILKAAGCNAIRTSHNPPTPEFLDACDKLGFLVIDEAFDKWKGGYYAKYFDAWWKKDLAAMILRDRNHPSVILWSIGNETNEQWDKGTTGTKRLIMLRDFVRELDPTRLVSAALAPSQLSFNKNGFADALDVVGLNYQEQFFEDFHKDYPKRIFFGTEVFPYYRSSKARIREYDERNPWYDAANNDYVAGSFIWTGIDYLGESAGWPSRGWSTAPWDTCMFEKPYAAFFKAVWNPDKPLVSISVVDQSLNIDSGKDHWTTPLSASHWTFPQYEGYILHVQTRTNCDEVELWVNNAYMGKRNLADFKNNTIDWRVRYQSGKIIAKGWKNGKVVTTDVLRTAGKPAKIALVPDRTTIASDGQDLVFIRVELQDEKGVVVPNADTQIKFSVRGGGKLVGLDNGDLRNNESYKGDSHSTYFGKLLAIVQSNLGDATPVTVCASASGLPETSLEIQPTAEVAHTGVR